MNKRVLKRQLGLFQVIMLGTAGTIAAEIFVLTGHAAAISGPAAILAIIIGGFLSYSIALNYSELATIYPETGGAMTYVREAWGNGLLSFVVGSMDCISSTFYCALSAVGFAYSLSVFFPGIPIVLTAIGVILFFTLLNIRGVSGVGNAQIVLGGVLLTIFSIYIIYGFISPSGFSLSTLLPEGRLFVLDTPFQNFSAIMKSIALVYAAYVGFEVIADDAEEIRRPEKFIPIGILVSLTLITLIYSSTMAVTLGTIPWYELAGSETALTDAISKFMPGIGVTLMAFAGLVATMTSVNSSMLSATREAFTLSRDGLWPQSLSHLNRFRVPFMSVIFIGAVSSLITIIGLVDFLSFITSAGYLFVLFWSNLSMIKLHKKYPAIKRPFKAPLFPFTPIIASLTCLVVIVFSDPEPLMFTAGIIGLFIIYYFSHMGVVAWVERRQKEVLPGSARLIVPVINSSASDNLMSLAAILAQAEQDINICLLRVVSSSLTEDVYDRPRYMAKLSAQRQSVLEKFIRYAVERNVPMYSKLVYSSSIADAIIQDVDAHRNTKMVLINRPERYLPSHLSKESARKIIDETHTNVGIMVDRGLEKIENILVAVGRGPHSQLAIHLANDIAGVEGAHVDYVRVLPAYKDEEHFEDEMAILQEIIITELGLLPPNAGLHLLFSDDVAAAIVEEASDGNCNLIICGISVGFSQTENLFGRVTDQIAEKAPCSVLVVKRYESATTTWLRRQTRWLEG